MVRGIAFAAAAGVLAAMPGVAVAAEDFTSGSVSYECEQNCGADLNWTGHGTPADAHGQAHIRQPGLLVDSKATVDCVIVTGNRATISGRLDDPSPATDGPFYAINVADNGPPSANDPDPDRVEVGYTFLPIDCTQPHQFEPFFPVTRGNAVVMDRTP